MNSSEWIECVADSRYEILNVYPYPIRKKGSTRCVSTFINKNTQFVEIHLGGKTWKLHRVIALQFKENPHNCSRVAHLNGNKFDNHLSNLCWCNPIRREAPPEPAQEPAQEQAQEPAQEQEQEPTQEQAQEPTQEQAQEPAQEEPTQEEAEWYSHDFFGNISTNDDSWWPF